MPLLGDGLYELNLSCPTSLSCQQAVFTCQFTGEIFLNYGYGLIMMCRLLFSRGTLPRRTLVDVLVDVRDKSLSAMVIVRPVE